MGTERNLYVLFALFKNREAHKNLQNMLLKYISCAFGFENSMENRLNDGWIHFNGTGELLAGEGTAVLPENLGNLDPFGLG